MSDPKKQEQAAPAARRGITVADLEDIFTYHAPTPDQLVQYESIRSKAREFAAVILLCTPTGPDQTVAIRKLRECVMTANAAVALGGKY